jgi:putative membrane protein
LESAVPFQVEFRQRWLPWIRVHKRLGVWLAAITIYAVAVAYVIQSLELPRWSAGTEATAWLGFILGILVVFRNNAAYDRWWEARKLWGQLINDSRNLASKIQAYATVDSAEQRQVMGWIVSFAHALRYHLRGIDNIASKPEMKNVPPKTEHVPGYFADRIHHAIARWDRDGSIGNGVWVLDVHARALLDVCGACERIRNTPLATAYRVLLRMILILYVLAAPWSLVLEVGYWAVPVLEVASFFLLGIEFTAEEVEEPFGRDHHDLPLESYCVTISNFVDELLDGPRAAPSRVGKPEDVASA